MYISQPPIKHIYWQMFREEISGVMMMPMLLAEFTFPGGVRMGEYYDLIAGTSHGYYAITWPNAERRSGRSSDADEANSTIAMREVLERINWYADRKHIANTSQALYVTLHTRSGSARLRASFLCRPTNLARYHGMLRKLEVFQLRGGDEKSWPYAIPTFDKSEEAMDMFLEFTQCPTTNGKTILFDLAMIPSMAAAPITISYKTTFQREEGDEGLSMAG
ncbi:hypothetical protein F4821DRAFT_262951 [Hypoxylon rubiginosum]|uniref:Uncharacterized protein n=1 Tax=Hypoxylon rubiginosum TaxID=110542 RepID=A0ACC0CSM7_9PEZI|nr:hypothetical protein F4821DRAFT_262951 [Hypoxylon rubiginosum]